MAWTKPIRHWQWTGLVDLTGAPLGMAGTLSPRHWIAGAVKPRSSWLLSTRIPTAFGCFTRHLWSIRKTNSYVLQHFLVFRTCPVCPCPRSRGHTIQGRLIRKFQRRRQWIVDGLGKDGL